MGESEEKRPLFIRETRPWFNSLAALRIEVDAEGSNAQVRTQMQARSFVRISAIAGNTLRELTRLRVFYVLLLFALVLIASSVFIARFSFQQELPVLKDIS